MTAWSGYSYPPLYARFNRPYEDLIYLHLILLDWFLHHNSRQSGQDKNNTILKNNEYKELLPKYIPIALIYNVKQTPIFIFQ